MSRNAQIVGDLAEIRKVYNGAVAGQTTIIVNGVDLTGFGNAAVIVDLGTVTDGCVLNLKLQQGNDAGGGDAADLSDPFGNDVGTGDITAAGASNKLLGIDAAGVAYHGQYLTIVLARGSQNAIVNSITVLLYRGKQQPVPLGSTVLSFPLLQCA